MTAPSSEEHGESGGPAQRADETAQEEQAAAAMQWSQFASTPEMFRPLAAAVGDFQSDKVENNFVKDVKWSPDGLCLLTSSDDNVVRLFEPGGAAEDSSKLEEKWRLPHHDRVKSILKVQEGETIYDLAWLPTMTSSDPSSCCFFSTSRDNPVHVWDAFTGSCRGSYCAYDDAEQLTAGYCIAFNTHAGSEQMYVGFNNCVKVFDLSRPGREHRTVPTFKRANRETTGQRGIISCIAFNPDKSGLYACGSYSRNIGLYAAPKGNLLYNLQGQRGGITQVQWSRDGNYLFSGGRKDREILCWDVRNTGDVLLSLPRTVSTNQRLQFDLDHSGRYLITPSHGSPTDSAHGAEDTAHQQVRHTVRVSLGNNSLHTLTHTDSRSTPAHTHIHAHSLHHILVCVAREWSASHLRFMGAGRYSSRRGVMSQSLDLRCLAPSHLGFFPPPPLCPAPLFRPLPLPLVCAYYYSMLCT